MKVQKTCIKQLIVTVIAFTVITIVIIFAMTTGNPNVALAAESESETEIYYAGGGTATIVKDSFGYVTKTVESYVINNTFPNYFNVNATLRNTCANVGGANIIGYYDRFYGNLIPSIEPGIQSSVYYYYPMTKFATQFQSVIDDLYTKMETNVNTVGSTQAQYKKGLTSYVNSKGLNVTYSSVMTNGQFDLNKAIAQFYSGNPITLYLVGYNFTTVEDDGSNVSWTRKLYDGSHIAIAYGYEKVTYYDAGGNAIKSEIYLYVSPGMQSVTGLYVVNSYGSLIDAEGVHIS